MKELSKADMLIPATGLILSIFILIIGNLRLTEGCLAGATLSSFDWLVIRLLFSKIASPGPVSGIKKLIIIFLISSKFFILAIIIYFMVIWAKFDGTGLAIGASCMPAGIIMASVLYMKGGQSKTEKNNKDIRSNA